MLRGTTVATLVVVWLELATCLLIANKPSLPITSLHQSVVIMLLLVTITTWVSARFKLLTYTDIYQAHCFFKSASSKQHKSRHWLVMRHYSLMSFACTYLYMQVSSRYLDYLSPTKNMQIEIKPESK